jgi:hypothetical protein
MPCNRDEFVAPGLGASGGGVELRMAELSSKPVFPLNGRSPEAISYNTTPRAQMSLPLSGGSPRSCSGAM